MGDGRNWWWFRAAAVVELLCDLDADLVALQEVRSLPRRYLRAKLPQYAVLGAGRDDGRHGSEHSLVLVRRWDLEAQHPGRAQLYVTGCSTRWFGPTPDRPGSRDPEARLPRCTTLVSVLDRCSGVRLGMAGVHLETGSGRARARAAAQLAQWCDEGPRTWIVAGDFNCAVDDPALVPLWSAGFRDALAGVPARGPKSATFHGFTGATDGERIDHLLVSPGGGLDVGHAEIMHDRVRGRLPSDHWPVMATLDRSR